MGLLERLSNHHSIISTTVTLLPPVYSPQFGNSTFPCSILSNSLVSSFTFDQPSKKIRFSVTGDAGTAGVCNITFPTQLLGGQYAVLMDGSPQSVTVTSNATYASIYFTYSHSTHNVEIIGTTAVPEFPTMTANILVLSVLTLMLLFTKRSHRSACWLKH